MLQLSLNDSSVSTLFQTFILLVPSKIKKHELECDYRDIVCAHMVHGCRVKCIKREMDHHMTTCHYKPMPCPVSDCNLKIPQKLLMQHLQKDHNILNKQECASYS